jgi:hypothetical protein
MGHTGTDALELLGAGVDKVLGLLRDGALLTTG